EGLPERAHRDDQVQAHRRRQEADLAVEDHDDAEQHLVVAVGLGDGREQRREQEAPQRPETARETKSATASICSGVNASANLGITPLQVRTASSTRALSGLIS